MILCNFVTKIDIDTGRRKYFGKKNWSDGRVIFATSADAIDHDIGIAHRLGSGIQSELHHDDPLCPVEAAAQQNGKVGDDYCMSS